MTRKEMVDFMKAQQQRLADMVETEPVSVDELYENMGGYYTRSGIITSLRATHLYDNRLNVCYKTKTRCFKEADKNGQILENGHTIKITNEIAESVFLDEDDDDQLYTGFDDDEDEE